MKARVVFRQGLGAATASGNARDSQPDDASDHEQQADDPYGRRWLTKKDHACDCGPYRPNANPDTIGGAKG